jgi:hypothetical protein
MPIHSESKPFASRKSFPEDKMDKMHTSPFLRQIGLESPDPSLLDVRSILAVALETVAQVRLPSPYVPKFSRTSPRRSELAVSRC